MKLSLIDIRSIVQNRRTIFSPNFFLTNFRIMLSFLIYLIWDVLIHLCYRESLYLFKIVDNFLLFDRRFLKELLWIFIIDTTIMMVVSISLNTKSKLILDIRMRLCQRSTHYLMNTLELAIVYRLIIIFYPWLIHVHSCTKVTSIGWHINLRLRCCSSIYRKSWRVGLFVLNCTTKSYWLWL